MHIEDGLVPTRWIVPNILITGQASQLPARRSKLLVLFTVVFDAISVDSLLAQSVEYRG